MTSIRLRFTYCKLAMYYYRQWWYSVGRNEKRADAAIDQMNRMWAVMSEPMRRFVQSRPDPVR